MVMGRNDPESCQEDTRKQVGIRYLLCRSESSTELKLSVSKRDVKQSFFKFIYACETT